MNKIYVGSTGSDEEGNGSRSSPYRTIKKAHDVAVGGDVIEIDVSAGLYIDGNYMDWDVIITDSVGVGISVDSEDTE